MDVTNLPSELLYLWHTYRTELIWTAGFLFGLARLIVYARKQRQKNATTPLGSPTAEKKSLDEILADSEKERQVAFEHYAATLPGDKRRERPKAAPKRVTGTRRSKSSRLLETRTEASLRDCIQPVIFYYTLGGSTRAYAETLGKNLTGPNAAEPILHDLTTIDYDDFFISIPKASDKTSFFYVIIVPTYNIDTELSNFIEHLKETHHDFRIDTAPLACLAGYSVFGLGDIQEWPTEQDGFCSQAREVDKWMARLTGRKRAFPIGMGDVRSDASSRLEEWSMGVQEVMTDVARGKGLGEGVPGSGEAAESGDEYELEAENSGDEEMMPRSKETKRARTDDLEDLGGKSGSPVPIDFTTSKPRSLKPVDAPKAMVPESSPTYTSLTKQGYTIVGTHSGVKICRWTKSALRGRGSCYKYSFYGIKSHLCMETTPSLSCSNKCVFCWRHGTNPVGTTWRWQVDSPDLIFAGVKEGHYKKIKMMRGVPGVRAERFQEAMQIRHCALSLVGEPIFYPHINELLAMLHKERISSFLVCNAQHPDQLAALGPVTQLYVSIDASNKESLRKIDRPLHRDFWERFLRCMDILRQKRNTHRTVFRLTLVKGFNIDEEAEGYADLVERALPSFIEVKGVTYCGTSTAAGAGLSMQNVPFYEEVSAFVVALEAALQRRGIDYGIGAEHAHSCCILLADRRRYMKTDEDGLKRWHTLIDYARFFECLESGKAFGPEDYIGPATPEWALWGNGGFDPRDERVDRKGRPKEEVTKVGGGKVVALGGEAQELQRVS